MTRVKIEHEDIWDHYFMSMADLVATRSKDRSMKCGCVVVGEGNTVLSTGYNGFPRGANDNDEALHQRPIKYVWTAHDAANAVFNAARIGTKLLYARVYLSAHPCHDCARAIVQVGIIEVIIPTKDDDPFYKMNRWTDWEESFNNAREIFKAGNVMVTEYGI